MFSHKNTNIITKIFGFKQIKQYGFYFNRVKIEDNYFDNALPVPVSK